MLDPDSGLLVPILAVTIHPQTGLVYPLGGVSVCPLTRLPQPIQLGSPMLDPRTGNVVLTAGVGLDTVTGVVLPVGGVLLGESFIEPLSGRLVRVGGASVRAGQLVPHAGGYQTLLGYQVLLGRLRVVELLRELMEDWGSRDTRLQPPPSLSDPPQPCHSLLPQTNNPRLPQPDPNSPLMKFSNPLQLNNPNLPQTNLPNLPQPNNPNMPQPDHPLPQPDPQPDLGRLQSAVSELQQVSRRSLHCQLQLQTRLEMLLDWACAVARDGGVLGELPLPDSELCVPALLGQEYPDPQGSGLQVPVLGAQPDPLSGRILALAGTMEDPQGKGLVAIRCGALAIDPVTGGLAAVVGARLDPSTRTVVPVTAPYWLALGEQPDSIQVEALQKEVCVRTNQWLQQKQKEEELLSDLDVAVQRCLHTVSLDPPGQVPWADSERQLREAVLELQESGQSEAQSRAARQGHLALVLPPCTLHTLTISDAAEWEQRCVCQAELLAGLDLVSVCVEGLQQDQERWTKEEELTGAGHTEDWALRQRELWEQLTSRQAELDSALSALHCTRLISQLHAETAQAVLSRKFWYRDFGLGRPSGPAWAGEARTPVKVVGVAQQKTLVLLERLTQLLEQKQPSLPPSACCQHLSGLSRKQAYGLEACSPVWTASLPGVKGISTQSLREPGRAQGSRPHTRTAQRHTAASSGVHSQESQPMKEQAHPTHVCVPTLSEEEWDKLLEFSPLFQLLKGVELQLRGRAREAGLLRAEACDRSGVVSSFVDVMDAHWECEGELIPLEVTSLNLRETLVLQHGLFLLGTLHSLGLTPAVSLQIAASLPPNNYHNNAFRNSFFYKEVEETVFVRRQRLQCVGGFSLLLTHCMSHIAVRDLSNDSSPAFQRVFFKALQACMGELFQARLGGLSPAEEASSWDSLSYSSPLLERLQRPSRSLLSQDDMGKLQQKHREVSQLRRAEDLLKEMSSSDTQGHPAGMTH
ncbi:uncharacterized protein si:dkey-103g5.4 [Hypomesus transpacificus]|uniref:uncharacterized protein si:dkey-103g5.4 n=1 Tax=Hypomesus transpacificus TaxID=137520 RepID=UPI001F0865BE|nr:uncharacterized protein si:dkey-103g5.4 [Hypomesus transpacificus]